MPTNGRKRLWLDATIPWLFLLPAIVVFLLFKYLPTLITLYTSFYNYNMMQPPGLFVGLGNYVAQFQDPTFWLTWKNNLLFFFWGLVFGFWVPIVQAILLDEVKKAKGIYRVVYLLPAVVPPICVLLVWKLLYHPEYGWINQVLEFIGLHGQPWLNSTSQAMIALKLPLLFGGGTGFLIYLAGLQGVPEELYEASEIDGAKWYHKIAYIQIPFLLPAIWLNFLFALINSFQEFDAPFVMTGGGPGNATRTVVQNIYEEGIGAVHFGSASSLSIMLFVVTMAVSLFAMRFERKEI